MIFAAAGAVSAGVEVEIDVITGHAEVSLTVAGLSLALPVALFVLGVWLVALRPRIGRPATVGVLAGARADRAGRPPAGGRGRRRGAAAGGIVIVLERDAVATARPAR